MKNILFILLVFATSNIDAQKLAPTLFSTSGTESKKQGISYSYSIGELIVPSVKNRNILTQGFEQPTKIKIEQTKKDTSQIILYEAYPNPITNQINISFKKKYNLNYLKIDVFDFTGRIVITQNKISDSKIQINTNMLKAGQYIVRISSFGEQYATVSFKVIKL